MEAKFERKRERKWVYLGSLWGEVLKGEEGTTLLLALFDTIDDLHVGVGCLTGRCVGCEVKKRE